MVKTFEFGFVVCILHFDNKLGIFEFEQFTEQIAAYFKNITQKEVNEYKLGRMKVAVEGCAHGELEKIYDTIAFIEEQENMKVDLLLCCGDFQATRNLNDLECMAVPKKFRDICTFYK